MDHAMRKTIVPSTTMTTGRTSIDSCVYSAFLENDIAERVAAITDDDPGAESERPSYNALG